MATLLIQVIVILGISRLCGWLFRRIHQPQVVGEMVAGIILGPSVLGAISPAGFMRIFPSESLDNLNTLAQVGLVLFMFLVGVELDPRLLRGRGRSALIISQASIIVPFLLGVAMATAMYDDVSGPPITRIGFALFIGAAMSVTAFPVLARILKERGLSNTRIGSLAIACAAVDDVTAWCILAVVVVIVREAASPHPLYVTLIGSIAYVVAMLMFVRVALRKVRQYYDKHGRVTQGLLTGVLLVALVSALITDWLGIHALFGAFLAGAILPKDEALIRELTGQLEDLVVVFLLPIFFAFIGLRTFIGLIQGPAMWMWCGAIILAAVAGKLGASAIAAHASGLEWREALSLGALLNTRGLMQLIILTIGLDISALTPPVFAMMVVMAIVTTLMTTPLLQWLHPELAK